MYTIIIKATAQKQLKKLSLAQIIKIEKAILNL
jgi:mRNA-degrading endonuclease RelE of RelBE toxin-antitoxin system